MADDPGPGAHPCARCAAIQKTCCQRADILVTPGDIERIAAHTGRDAFWSLRRPDDPASAEHDPEDPDWHRLSTLPDGRRRLLDRQPGGDCTFLGHAGCILPTEVRPLVCRLYPFDYTERGIRGVFSGYCPTERLIPRDQPGVTMLTILGMEHRDGERWRAMLYAELRGAATPARTEDAPCASA